MTADLDALFTPRHVAVWGASATDSSKLGNVLLSNAASDTTCTVSPIHRSADSLDGFPAASAPPSGIDLALISLPADAVESAVVQAAEAGAQATIVLASGFSEAGVDGAAAERRLVEISRSASMRLVGPNCMGVVSRNDAVWFNGTYFWSVPLVSGPIGFISQSGAFGGVFFDRLRSQGLGMSRFVSVGNSADVNETDIIEWLAADAATEVIGLFCESLGGGRQFVEAVRTVANRKPVIVLKSGKATTGARAAAGHTGALTSDHLVVQSALRRAGAIEAETTDEFFDLLQAASTASTASTGGDRFAIVTVSGGPSVLAADTVDVIGARLPEADQDLQSTLADLVPAFAATANPFDLTPQCDPESFAPVIDAVYESDAFDRVVVVNCGIDSLLMADAVVEAERRHRKPTTAFLLDTPSIVGRFHEAGIAVFTSPEAAVRAHRGGLRTSTACSESTGVADVVRVVR